MGKRNKKRMSFYKKIIIVYTLLLVILAEMFLIYVNKSLVGYENGDLNNYMTTLIKDMKSAANHGNIDKYLSLSDVKSEYEKKTNLKNGYKELFKKEITYKKTKEENTYDLYADKIKFATVKLDGSKVKKSLGLLTYVDWKTESIKAYNENGLYTLDFYINNNYTLYLNDIKVDKDNIKDNKIIKEYEDISDLVNLPSEDHYEITNLTYLPKIVIKNSEGKEVKYTVDNTKYYANDYYNAKSLDDANKHLANEANPLKIAETWSLFMTANNDMDGYYAGFSTISPYLIKGTTMYQKAYQWATGVDTTFTSAHRLAKETFTNEKVSNITVYNDLSYSAEVYLEKNLILADGQKRKDVLHNMCYFAYYDGSYKLIYMTSIVEE